MASKRKRKRKISEGLAAAIKAAGNESKLADAIEKSRQAVNKWTEVPAELVVDVERATGVARKVLRPDLYA